MACQRLRGIEAGGVISGRDGRAAQAVCRENAGACDVAGVVTLARLASDGPLPVAIILAVAGLMMWRPLLHPVWFLIGGAAVCYLVHAAGW
jgi:hypothetical protein